MTTQDELALRERVAVKLGEWERCPRCKGTHEVNGKLCQHPSAHKKVPTLSELCAPMLEWLGKQYADRDFASGLGLNDDGLWQWWWTQGATAVERARFGKSVDANPSLALALAVDALEVE